MRLETASTSSASLTRIPGRVEAEIARSARRTDVAGAEDGDDGGKAAPGGGGSGLAGAAALQGRRSGPRLRTATLDDDVAPPFELDILEVAARRMLTSPPVLGSASIA